MEQPSPKKLLIIQTVRFGANGMTSFALNGYRHFDRRRINADFLLLNEPPERVRSEIEGNGDHVYVLPERNRNPLGYLIRLTRLIKNNGYDVVHAHGNSATLYVEMLAARLGGAKIRIPHSHNTACNKKLAHALLKGPFARSYTDALACGREAGEWLFPDAPFTVMNNAIDTERFRFDPGERARLRKEYGWEDAFVLIHVGSFNGQKNHRFLIDAFAALHEKNENARLLLLGEGPLMDETELAVYQRGLSGDVKFLGPVPCAAPYLSAADAFALPSLYEGLPFTLVEAQCAGLPCYVSDTVTREAFFTPLAAALPLSAGPEAWAEAIQRGGARQDRARTSADAAATIADAGYDVQENAEALMRFYERCGTLRKLLLVTHKMTGGGCERVVAQVANAFAKEGLDCLLVSECSVPSFYKIDPGVRQLSLLDTPDMGSRDVWTAYRRLRALVKEQRPDLVLAMPEKVNVWTVLFLLGTGVPVVVSERNDPRRHPENKLKRLLRRLCYPLADGFIFQAQQAADYFPKRIRARGVVLPNPLDVSALPPVFAGERAKTVVAAGRLEPQKNFALLIRAFSDFYQTHPDWNLVIYGEGGEREALAALAAGLPEGVVSLPGQTDRLAEALSGKGIFALSSDFEGMPNALIEAMAMGCPCAATDCPAGGCAALIKDGQNGLLIPVGDAAALSAAFSRIADDVSLSNTLSNNAVGIRERLDARSVMAKWRSYLDAVAAK